MRILCLYIVLLFCGEIFCQDAKTQLMEMFTASKFIFEKESYRIHIQYKYYQHKNDNVSLQEEGFLHKRGVHSIMSLGDLKVLSDGKSTLRISKAEKLIQYEQSGAQSRVIGAVDISKILPLFGCVTSEKVSDGSSRFRLSEPQIGYLPIDNVLLSFDSDGQLRKQSIEAIDRGSMDGFLGTISNISKIQFNFSKIVSLSINAVIPSVEVYIKTSKEQVILRSPYKEYQLIVL